MSFNPFQLEPSILARLQASPISGATQGAWDTVAPPRIKISPGGDPFIVFFLVSGSFDGMTFENNIASATYQVSVFDHKANGIVPATTVAGQIFGDSEGTDNEPTYGLARWKIPAVTDAATAMMVPESFGTQHTDDELHYWMTFSVEIQEA